MLLHYFFWPIIYSFLFNYLNNLLFVWTKWKVMLITIKSSCVITDWD